MMASVGLPQSSGSMCIDLYIFIDGCLHIYIYVWNPKMNSFFGTRTLRERVGYPNKGSEGLDMIQGCLPPKSS